MTTVPRDTKITIGFWLALAVVWLLLAVGRAVQGEWSLMFTDLCSGSVAAYIALLIYERDEAREFRRRLVENVSTRRWTA